MNMQLGENSGGKRHCFLGDVLNHTLGVLVEHGVVLDDDQGVAGPFKNSHELKDCEGLAVKLAMLLQLLSLSNTTILSAQ